MYSKINFYFFINLVNFCYEYIVADNNFTHKFMTQWENNFLGQQKYLFDIEVAKVFGCDNKTFAETTKLWKTNFDRLNKSFVQSTKILLTKTNFCWLKQIFVVETKILLTKTIFCWLKQFCWLK